MRTTPQCCASSGRVLTSPSWFAFRMFLRVRPESLRVAETEFKNGEGDATRHASQACNHAKAPLVGQIIRSERILDEMTVSLRVARWRKAHESYKCSVLSAVSNSCHELAVPRISRTPMLSTTVGRCCRDASDCGATWRLHHRGIVDKHESEPSLALNLSSPVWIVPNVRCTADGTVHSPVQGSLMADKHHAYTMQVGWC